MTTDRPSYTRQTPHGSIVPFVVFYTPDDPDEVQALVDPEVVIGVVNGAGGQVDVVTMATRIHLFGIPFADVLAALAIAPVPPKPHTRRRHPLDDDSCVECSQETYGGEGGAVRWTAAARRDPERHPSRPSTVAP